MLASICFYIDRATTRLLLYAATIRAATSDSQAKRDGLNRGYTERNRIVCLLARQILNGGGNAGTFTDPHGEAGFRIVVAFDLPSGQCTFHMDERDTTQPWATLPPYAGAWDGHSDATKWQRISSTLHAHANEAP